MVGRVGPLGADGQHSFWSYFSTDPSSILGTYQPGEFVFPCPIFLPFPTIHGVLKARILKLFAFPSPVDHILSELNATPNQDYLNSQFYLTE